MPRKSFLLPLLLSLLIVLPLSGCRQSPSTPKPTGTLRQFPVRGRVVSIDGTQVMLDHEAIPGFMEAMVMPYKLKDPSIVSELHPGDRISATILVREDEGGYHDAELDNIVITAQAKPDYKPPVQYHVPTPGDSVPDFTLLNQSARKIHLAQFKGKVLVATFVYTRCPLADYCPRMSRNFAQIDLALAADPKLYAQTHLLSISFDPAYDTPAVLRSYGGAYTGRYTKETFTHWDFAAPSQNDLPAVTKFFGVGVTPGENNTLTHSLSTVIIGKDGKIAAWYPSNDWQTTDVIAQIKKAAQAS